MKHFKNRSESAIATSREQTKINDDWFTAFEQQLTKQAVKSKREDNSLFNQINSIINNSKNGKHSSVEDKVKEMQERSGYASYSSAESNMENKKTADKDEVKKNTKPQLLMQYPEIEVTINNYITDTNGNQSLPAILNHVRGIHKKDTNEDKLWDAEDLIKYVDSLNEKAVKSVGKETNQNLGKLDLQPEKDVDPSNTDVFHSLMPVTK